MPRLSIIPICVMCHIKITISVIQLRMIKTRITDQGESSIKTKLIIDSYLSIQMIDFNDDLTGIRLLLKTATGYEGEISCINPVVHRLSIGNAGTTLECIHVARERERDTGRGTGRGTGGGTGTDNARWIEVVGYRSKLTETRYFFSASAGEPGGRGLPAFGVFTIPLKWKPTGNKQIRSLASINSVNYQLVSRRLHRLGRRLHDKSSPNPQKQSTTDAINSFESINTEIIRCGSVGSLASTNDSDQSMSINQQRISPIQLC